FSLASLLMMRLAVSMSREIAVVRLATSGLLVQPLASLAPVLPPRVAGHLCRRRFHDCGVRALGEILRLLRVAEPDPALVAEHVVHVSLGECEAQPSRSRAVHPQVFDLAIGRECIRARL